MIQARVTRRSQGERPEEDETPHKASKTFLLRKGAGRITLWLPRPHENDPRMASCISSGGASWVPGMGAVSLKKSSESFPTTFSGQPGPLTPLLEMALQTLGPGTFNIPSSPIKAQFPSLSFLSIMEFSESLRKARCWQGQHVCLPGGQTEPAWEAQASKPQLACRSRGKEIPSHSTFLFGAR